MAPMMCPGRGNVGGRYDNRGGGLSCLVEGWRCLQEYALADESVVGEAGDGEGSALFNPYHPGSRVVGKCIIGDRVMGSSAGTGGGHHCLTPGIPMLITSFQPPIELKTTKCLVLRTTDTEPSHRPAPLSDWLFPTTDAGVRTGNYGDDEPDQKNRLVSVLTTCRDGHNLPVLYRPSLLVYPTTGLWRDMARLSTY